MVILVHEVDAAAARAVGIVRSVRPSTVEAITFDATTGAAWRRLAPEIGLKVLAGDGRVADRVKAHLRGRRQELPEDAFLTLVVPEVLKSEGFAEIILRSRLHRLKGAMLGELGVQVLDVPIVRADIDPTVDDADEPARHHVCILVSGVHNATLQAIEYAETLRPTDIRAVSFGLDPAETEELGDAWIEAGIAHPLEIEASPFRDIGYSVLDYIKQFEPDGTHRIVTVVIPEFVVSKRRHQLLHGQTALLVKSRVLFAPGVVAASVPYHLTER